MHTHAYFFRRTMVSNNNNNNKNNTKAAVIFMIFFPVREPEQPWQPFDFQTIQTFHQVAQEVHIFII